MGNEGEMQFCFSVSICVNNMHFKMQTKREKERDRMYVVTGMLYHRIHYHFPTLFVYNIVKHTRIFNIHHRTDVLLIHLKAFTRLLAKNN